MSDDIYGLSAQAYQQLRELIRKEAGRQSPIQNPIRRKHVYPSAAVENTFIVPMLQTFVTYAPDNSAATYIGDYTGGGDNPIGYLVPDIDENIDIIDGSMRIRSDLDPAGVSTKTFEALKAGYYEFEFHSIFDVTFTNSANYSARLRCGKEGTPKQFQTRLTSDATTGLKTDLITVSWKYLKLFSGSLGNISFWIDLPSSGTATNKSRVSFASGSLPIMKITKTEIDLPGREFCNYSF